MTKFYLFLSKLSFTFFFCLYTIFCSFHNPGKFCVFFSVFGLQFQKTGKRRTALSHSSPTQAEKTVEIFQNCDIMNLFIRRAAAADYEAQIQDIPISAGYAGIS